MAENDALCISKLLARWWKNFPISWPNLCSAGPNMRNRRFDSYASTITSAQNSYKQCSHAYILYTSKGDQTELNKRRLGKRMKEHQKTVQKAKVEVSSLAEHAWKSDHRVDWEQITVLDYSTDWHKWLTLEACHISRQPMPLNKDRGMLPAKYDRLMRITWSRGGYSALFLVTGSLAVPYMYILKPSQHSLYFVFVVCTFLYHPVWPPFDVYSI